MSFPSPLSPRSENGTTSKIKSQSDTPLFSSTPDQILTALHSVTSERIRQSLKADLKESRLSRDEISDELTRVTGTKYSKPMLDAFIAESKPHRFPAELIPAWCTVLGSRRLIDTIAAEVGLALADEESRDFEQVGRTHLKLEKLREKLWERA